MNASALQLLEQYRRGERSPLDAINAALSRIAALDPQLGAMTTLCAERAQQEAVSCERAYEQGRPQGALAGVPLVVKDLFDTADVPTAYGSSMFAGRTPAADATVVRHVRDAGAIVVGKSQTHEFAWGITSVNERMGTSRNPWRPDRISGGSSGGSAVSLAAGYVPLAIGSDTGGSIRVPAAFCGTVGFKPTFGRLSTGGLWPLAPSLDHPGSMANTPADAALLFCAMQGQPWRPVHGTLSGRGVGVCTDLHQVPLSSQVQAMFDNAVRTVARLGAEVRHLSMRHGDAIHPAFTVIQHAEALRTHREAGLYPQYRDEYGDDVRGRLEHAERVTLRDYLQATVVREQARASIGALFREVDVLLTPVAAGSPARMGDDWVEHAGRTIEFRELVMTYTTPQDLVGIPACTVRAGFDELGIPIGVQFSGPPGADFAVLAAAEAYFQATPKLQARKPDLAS